MMWIFKKTLYYYNYRYMSYTWSTLAEASWVHKRVCGGDGGDFYVMLCWNTSRLNWYQHSYVIFISFPRAWLAECFVTEMTRDKGVPGCTA